MSVRFQCVKEENQNPFAIFELELDEDAENLLVLLVTTATMDLEDMEVHLQLPSGTSLVLTMEADEREKSWKSLGFTGGETVTAIAKEKNSSSSVAQQASPQPATSDSGDTTNVDKETKSDVDRIKALFDRAPKAKANDAQEKKERSAIDENLYEAMEYYPQLFGSVNMLYVKGEIDGVPVKFFVDSGAQISILSRETVEKCGLMHLVDTRMKMMMVGVGKQQSIGRIYLAPVKLGNLYLPCSFHVMEDAAMPVLLGLDSLKGHRMCIDLASNCLRVDETEIPFLPESEIDRELRLNAEAEASTGEKKEGEEKESDAKEMKREGEGEREDEQLKKVKNEPPVGGEVPTLTEKQEAAVQMFTSITGGTREEALALLDASDWDVDAAVSFFLGD